MLTAPDPTRPAMTLLIMWVTPRESYPGYRAHAAARRSTQHAHGMAQAVARRSKDQIAHDALVQPALKLG